MGAKAGVAVGVVTALLGIGGAAVSVRATRATPEARRRTPVVRTDEGEALAAGDPERGDARAFRPGAPAWNDAFEHVVLATRSAPSAADPVGATDRRADSVLLYRVRAVPGVVDAQLVGPGLVSVATSGSLTALAQVDGVVGLDRDVPLAVAADPREAEQWQYTNSGDPKLSAGSTASAGADVDAVRAWTVNRGVGVVVAVIDTGVEVAHPDLAARVWHNTADPCGNGLDDDGNGFVDDCDGWDFGVGDNDPNPDTIADPLADITAHGTHVAGLIAAARNGVGGVGTAPDASIMALKISGATGGISLARVGAAMRYAADNGARVINLSLSTGPYAPRSSVPALETAVAYARTKGVLVVAGASNDGLDISEGDIYPAGFSLLYDNVVAVGATTASDRRAPFSNHGLPSPLQIYAPGYALLSTMPGGTWGRMSGTSMATPIVAGAAALVISSGRATEPSAVRALLGSSARSLPFGSRLDAAVALGLDRAVASPTTTTVAQTTAAPTTAAPVAPTTSTRAPTPTVPRTATSSRPPVTTTTAARPTTTARPAPATTRAAVTPTSTTGPLVTTPTPAPVVSGRWKLTALSTRSAPLTGGKEVQATGVFPTGAKVRVWFSGLGPVVDAAVAADGTSLTFTTPSMSVRTVTEVTVRFMAGGRTVALGLPNAFTFAPNG